VFRCWSSARLARSCSRVGRAGRGIAARFDLLDPEQKGLLQDAAVIGKRFWTGALASFSGADPSTLAPRLHELERKEFVRRERSSSVADESEYDFRHLLVRDVAYGQIPCARRAEKHLAAARWTEGLGRREDHSEMLAHHYLQALELTTALEAAHEELLAAGDVAGAAEAETILCDHLWMAGERDAAMKHLEEARRLVDPLAPSEAKARVMSTSPVG
jgi:predicted ATPase